MRSRRQAAAPRTCQLRQPRARALAVAWVLGLGIGAAGAQAQDARFVGEVAPTNAEGHLTLRWEADGTPTEYQVEHAATSGFASPEVWYEGPATQTFISGLEEGDHFYRVRARGSESAAWGPWGESVGLTVEHQDMRLAWSLFGVGAVLFGSIVGFVAWQAFSGNLGGGAGDE